MIERSAHLSTQATKLSIAIRGSTTTRGRHTWTFGRKALGEAMHASSRTECSSVGCIRLDTRCNRAKMGKIIVVWLQLLPATAQAVTTGGRSGGGYDGSPQARAAVCYDGAFGYESLSYDVASAGHDPSHLWRYSSSVDLGAGYVTSQNSSPRTMVVKYKQYAVLLSPPMSPLKSPPPSPGSVEEWGQMRGHLQASRCHKGNVGCCKRRYSKRHVGGVGTSATFGTFELDANVDNTQSRLNWNRLSRGGLIGIGCQEQGLARSNFRRLASIKESTNVTTGTVAGIDGNEHNGMRRGMNAAYGYWHCNAQLGVNCGAGWRDGCSSCPTWSAMRLSFNNNNNIKIEDADYYEVCKPSTHNHMSCTKLLNLGRKW
uniref:Predicted protein n=1 Tax=Physcomitrium patens TaxID=3218 RepID=A9U1C4_PHYPA